ncbi:MAG TPA: crosslink repair DNA glycosylase YcaQ family protein [Gaiellaceae bacterium]|nr:crosslink repair DNA glycosylase YcaQ family protein [Gaiellaceae bacterium]
MPTASRTVTLAEIRRTIVSAQGYASRFRRATGDDVEQTIRRLTAVQLDSISTVDRAHRLTLASRIGAFDAEAVPQLLGEGRIFEYWAHEASLLPVELWPHFRRAMDGAGHWGTHDRALRDHSGLVEPILSRIRDEGPLGSRDFEGRGADEMGGMWNWKPAKMVLDALWDRGRLVISGRRSFQRLYDLPERVIPQAVLDAPTPTEDESLRALALLAVHARGALTEPAIREHWRLKGGKARLHHHLLALVDEGRLREVQVDDGGAPFFVPAEADLEGEPAPPVLVCPFDNLVWDRPLLERVFGFRHVIEVYKREHERAYGYYVLPLLAGDRFVGRADLKADRAEGVLYLRRFTPEPKARLNVDAKLERAALRLARTIGLERVERLA